MRWVRYEYQGQRAWGIVEGERVRRLRGAPWGEREALRRGVPLDAVRLLAPCEPTKVVAIGLNYKSHAAEVGVPIPEEPAMFIKPVTSIVGPGDPVVYPRRSRRLDYEAELACVIGTRMHRVPEAEALRHVLGYTCLNDVTARDIQTAGGNFLNMTWGKGYDTFCPVGPWLVDDVDPDDVLVEGYLDGARVQSASTRDFIFSMARQLSWISDIMTLLPGDVVTTGTPSGIGPMAVGATFEVRISGIGSLHNPIVAEA
ncbi:MAG TPA: fumarylacetoacetate hydrolase family protein [Candidatus Binatia bacterium]|nr:fumarylacetoacetate hydrolase family protein [Candidatus Binatia bacterium]